MKKEDDYKIVFDSNKLYIDKNRPNDDFGTIFSSNIIEMVKFISEKKIKSVQLSIPEVSIQERVQQRFEELEVVIDKMDDSFKRLKPLKVFVKPSLYKKRDYRDLMMKSALSFLKENDIEIIKTALIKRETLIKRVYLRKPPFNKGDRGFKDTLIWMSVIADAKKNKSTRYIILSANASDFNPENLKTELKKEGLNNFDFFNNLPEIQEYLDKELVLNLKLKERNEKIEQEIRNITGDIIVQLNRVSSRYSKKKERNLIRGDFNYHIPINRYSEEVFDIHYPQKEIFEAFDFQDISILDIKEVGGNIFSIDATVSVIDKASQKDWRHRFALFYREDNSYPPAISRDIDITLRYDRAKKEVNIERYFDRRWKWDLIL